MKKVFVGLSGGVDSSLAALLLQKQGYSVTGVFLKNWSGEEYGLEDSCPWEKDLASAREIASFLNIELLVYNFERDYRELVIKDFFYQYSVGNTPNPDILCNKYIKFDKFLKKALEDGAEYIATGHYAKTDNVSLFKPKDTIKDQTYFLHQLTQDQLKKSLFPLANLTKSEVRELAKLNGLPNHNRKDSQGICFVGKVDIKDFLKQELKEIEGKIVDIDSNTVVGKHIGVWFYTIGQRQGLNIGGLAKPYFVVKKDVESNTLYVGQGKRHPMLWHKTFIVDSLHLINPAREISGEDQLTGIIRYRGVPTISTVKKLEGMGNKYQIEFETSQWAGTVGQSLVLYSKAECVGGGIISEIK